MLHGHLPRLAARLHRIQDTIQPCSHPLWKNFLLEAGGEWMDIKPNKGKLETDKSNVIDVLAAADC